ACRAPPRSSARSGGAWKTASCSPYVTPTWIISRSTTIATATTTAIGSSTSCRASSTTSRSEEHTSELQSRFDLVCRLLLEKKKINVQYIQSNVVPYHIL